ncbi:acetolactate decarboxylase [Sulfurovum sp. NBC37-1]|uniref:acetolactate decarboxylase n=1 Tax=Sulfurovum sp. (strain NBC37-1) TaxID=387093 RepID=UPI00015875AF|nr:acetolactate decarboxylase [Sulfurovum sp. NBC37-1]BAF71828.1 alpha-acetolactate decarboxylase [Sulfurovum sp. NBC37-1]
MIYIAGIDSSIAKRVIDIGLGEGTMRSTLSAIFFTIVLGFIISGCQSSHKVLPSTKQNVLFQYSTLDALLQGAYDGNMSCGELKDNGDFGLGTFNALDGEMIVMDGQIYQVASDGVARVMDDSIKIPFATVAYFEADQTVALKQSMDCSELKTYIDDVLPAKNITYGIKIKGLFSYIKTRSVPRQTKPYPLLVDVIKTQPTFEFFQQRGTIVGFRLPEYIGEVNVAGYHFHFLTQDKKAGGHVLECQVKDVIIEIDYMSNWQILLPTT